MLPPRLPAETYVQSAETQMSFSIDGYSEKPDVHLGAFATRVAAPSTAPPPPPVEPEPDFDGSNDGSSICLHLPHPFMPQTVSHNFADILAGTGLSVSLPDYTPLHLSYMQGAQADTVSVTDDGSEASGDVAGGIAAQGSVVHGCRAMPPQGAHSFLRHDLSSSHFSRCVAYAR
ncbi:hypothetical protein CYMTET_56407 [Cymbomonas tetramitiformis]|uniref:Uncharacterized protein n=1 Tax=Cymbomonas tetramitiformis TaxID=36881 RepID=A0AAE0ELZ9_9CHLO|nr:hypothetical protein CYMTET_56407 [Cymbomonas tetramitiformis]